MEHLSDDECARAVIAFARGDINASFGAPYGAPALSVALRRRLSHTVAALAARGDVDPNVSDQYGNRPLHIALGNGMARLLLDTFPDVDQVTIHGSGWTPLQFAARCTSTTLEDTEALVTDSASEAGARDAVVTMRKRHCAHARDFQQHVDWVYGLRRAWLRACIAHRCGPMETI